MQETPMMKQYMGFKRQYNDKILLYRMGDFFETFGEDAKIASKVLNITLTTRDKKTDATLLAGFPHHALDQYLPKLIQAGYCVVIVDQIEDPKLAKGIVKRAVTRIVTPGTMEQEDAGSSKNQFIAAFFRENKRLGVALLDLAIGRFVFTSTKFSQDSIERIISSYSPAEILISALEKEMSFNNIPVQILDRDYSNASYVKKVLQDFYNVERLEGFGLENGDVTINALAMIIEYIQETQKMKPRHIDVPKQFSLNRTMYLDSVTIRNLELIAKNSTGSKNESIFGLLDETKTHMGRRLLYSYILNPLIDREEIEKRYAQVELFYSDSGKCENVRMILEKIVDIERIVGKIGLNRVNGRDLKALQLSLQSVLQLTDVLNNYSFLNLDTVDLKNVSEFIGYLEKSISDSPPTTITEGYVIKKGYNSEIDELRALSGDSKGWLKEFESKEKKRSGISSLKVSFNKVFGYYIEVTHTHKDKIPKDYIRKQTLVNSERYITEELKSREEIILSAEEKMKELEYKVFQDVRELCLSYLNVLKKVSVFVSEVDVFSNFAYISRYRNYVKPNISDFGQNNGEIYIKAGRHPIVEMISSDDFISNDTDINLDNSRMIVITVPNMSVKSTYIRQVATIVLLAQIGSYVPANECRISIVDRIFTRVGASDDLSGGRSTFMVEMNEAANIVNNATKYSLVILDEIGRGTSTYDGVSIAWALSEYLSTTVLCRTMFATHYHELSRLSENRELGIKNYNVMVEEDLKEGTVIFLRKIIEGGADRSYGIYVAKMAGIPMEIINRANEILGGFEQESMFSDGVTIRGESTISRSIDKKKLSDLQIPLFKIENGSITKELEEIDIDTLTPVEALNIIAKWKKR